MKVLSYFFALNVSLGNCLAINFYVRGIYIFLQVMQILFRLYILCRCFQLLMVDKLFECNIRAEPQAT